MKRRRIGSLEVSVAGLGCNNFGRVIDAAKTAEVVAAALDSGVTFFDTADLYADGLSEEYLGRALGAHRKSVTVVSKFGMMAPPPGTKPASAAWAARSCEGSLRRLGTDWIDLYLLHQPDPSTPIAETLGALGALVKAGKVREIGCSNFSIEQLAEAADAAKALGVPEFVCVQNECSLVHRDDALSVIPECASRGIAYLPFFPLASGLLTGKYERDAEPPEGTRFARATPERRARYFNDATFAIVDRAARFAADHGHTLHELALSWLASLPGVASVIPGATTASQVRTNSKAAMAWELSPGEVEELKEILED
jgi:aryl-alcohol dehydrogenase-like predicted oxidoreductase